MIASCGAWVWQGLFVDHNDLPTVRTSNWTERELAQVHSRIASRLKAALHVHISAADARGKVGQGVQKHPSCQDYPQEV